LRIVRREEKRRSIRRGTLLDRDVISLLESMGDELASVSNEGRKRRPERVVGKEFWETTFLLPDELVEAESMTK